MKFPKIFQKIYTYKFGHKNNLKDEKVWEVYLSKKYYVEDNMNIKSVE